MLGLRRSEKFLLYGHYNEISDDLHRAESFTQLVEKCPVCYRDRRFITVLTTASYWTMS
jgi:hypothetical protein